jgi:hypothetical protein
MAVNRETVIQQGVLAIIGSWPELFIWRNNTGALQDRTGRWVRFGLKGSSDIIGMIWPTGRFFALEMKTATGETRTAQLRFRKRVLECGGIYIIGRDVDGTVRAVRDAVGEEGRRDGSRRGGREAVVQQGAAPRSRAVGRVGRAEWQDAVPQAVLGGPSRRDR